MKLSMQWLGEWVRCELPPQQLGARLTMAGFELEALTPAAPPFSGVIVAEIIEAVRHPQADKLQVCRVATGSGEPLQIVCGAANARAGLRTALAQVGALLPGDLAIKAAKLRGVESAGMLCSAKELGLAESSDGIIELPADAPLGTDVRALLALDDVSLELNVTPNRGDAMSVLGLAREVAAITDRPLQGPSFTAVAAAHTECFPVEIAAASACPRFVARVIRGVDNRRTSPLWLRERLRRAGLRSISPVVDVTNHVLLELGQPMHAYDLARLDRGIRVRHAQADEPFELLDGRAVTLSPDMLVIADATGPVGLAGIMGGARTAVQTSTVDVLFEVAWFAPEAIAGRGRRLGLTTDASQRYERGVDPAFQVRAVERATQLLLEIAGGRAGPVQVNEHAEFLPVRAEVLLRETQVARLLGVAPARARCVELLQSLGMQVRVVDAGLAVLPPSHRFDITQEVDLIEEVARLFGYDQIPTVEPRASQRFRALPEAVVLEGRFLDLLAARGYFESISFSFVDPGLQQRLFPDDVATLLVNPIAADLAAMRVSLWPGLLRAALENQRRQQDRVRLFESAVVFRQRVAGVEEVAMLAGLICGSRLPEQWGAQAAAVDFHDQRADVEALLSLTGRPESFAFEAGAGRSCLHPGRSARIVRDGRTVGWIGELHPQQVREMDLTYVPVLFELEVNQALRADPRSFSEVSRFPQVRRDLALVVDESVPFSQIHERVTLVASGLLRDLKVFDVYRGAGVEAGRKSVALGLILQDNSRTLTDEDAERLMAAIRQDLCAGLQARIRE
jgi:phenylalanyl-tRNA synthetase beta chain